MEILFLTCAVIGGTVLVCQFVMTVAGLGGDHDFGGDAGHAGFDHDVPHDVSHDAAHEQGDDHHGSTWLFGVITFRTVVAAIAFFGLAGMASISANLRPGMTFLIAGGTGLAAMYCVHWLMQGLHRLRAEGTERIDQSVGKQGTVYLSIPARKAGAGKIHLSLQNRMVEYQAVSAAEEKLPSGATIVVVGVLGPDLVEVAPVPVQVT